LLRGGRFLFGLSLDWRGWLAADCCVACPGGLLAWRMAPPRHEGGGAGRRSRQAPSLAANAGPLRASCPPLRTSPLMTRRRTGCRWGRQGASAAQPRKARRSHPPTPPRQARATVPEGGVPGPRPPRRRRFEEVVWGAVGRVSATWMSPKSPHGWVHGVPDEPPHTASTEAAPRNGRGPGTPPTPGISP